MSCAKWLSVIAMALGVALAGEIKSAQSQQSLSQQLVGTWSFVVTAAHRKDGTKADVFGPNPNGVLMFHPDGHFVLINTRPGRPKYASGNRLQGTPDEFKETCWGRSPISAATASTRRSSNSFSRSKAVRFPTMRAASRCVPSHSSAMS